VGFILFPKHKALNLKPNVRMATHLREIKGSAEMAEPMSLCRNPNLRKTETDAEASDGMREAR
jgi:hypothetical protein